MDPAGFGRWLDAYGRAWMRDGAASARIRMDGVLVAVFDDEGRCREHREWYSVDEEAVAGSLG
jgi:hypothetical protein